MNRVLKNTLLVIFIAIFVLIVVEGLSRLIFDPIDFLKPKVSFDEVLRYKIEPNSGAHDSWGYRNKSVPDSIDIVAIGDSHTYGISATASDSWPNALQDISGRSTYNLSLGGYGPAEYLYLLEQKALNLNPDLIIAGLYLGNDLKDARTAVHTVSIWEDLRGNAPLEEVQDSKKIDKRSFTDWLAGNSVLYRIVSSSFIGDNLRQQRRLNKGEEVLMLNVEESGINTGFTPDRRLKGLDLRNPEVRDGLKYTLAFIKRMNELAKEKDTGFLVVIIPTKETVYSDLILEDSELSNSSKLSSLIQSEEVVNKIVKTYFRDNNIAFIDVKDSLRKAAGNMQIYPNNFGGHSNNNGYRIIAETINQYIESSNSN